MICIYSTPEGMAYQYHNRRTLVSKTGSYQFQVKDKDGWRNGRNSYAISTVEKVKQALA
jgi:hypothetical protein